MFDIRESITFGENDFAVFHYGNRYAGYLLGLHLRLDVLIDFRGDVSLCETVDREQED